jgi:hypothetical protein
MIADPEGPSCIARTVGHRRYADDASVSHDPLLTFLLCGKLRHSIFPKVCDPRTVRGGAQVHHATDEGGRRRPLRI